MHLTRASYNELANSLEWPSPLVPLAVAATSPWPCPLVLFYPEYISFFLCSISEFRGSRDARLLSSQENMLRAERKTAHRALWKYTQGQTQSLKHLYLTLFLSLDASHLSHLARVVHSFDLYYKWMSIEREKEKEKKANKLVACHSLFTTGYLLLLNVSFHNTIVHWYTQLSERKKEEEEKRERERKKLLFR